MKKEVSLEEIIAELTDLNRKLNITIKDVIDYKAKEDKKAELITKYKEQSAIISNRIKALEKDL